MSGQKRACFPDDPNDPCFLLFKVAACDQRMRELENASAKPRLGRPEPWPEEIYGCGGRHTLFEDAHWTEERKQAWRDKEEVLRAEEARVYAVRKTALEALKNCFNPALLADDVFRPYDFDKDEEEAGAPVDGDIAPLPRSFYEEAVAAANKAPVECVSRPSTAPAEGACSKQIA